MSSSIAYGLDYILDFKNPVPSQYVTVSDGSGMRQLNYDFLVWNQQNNLLIGSTTL